MKEYGKNAFALAGMVVSCASVPVWTASLLCLLGLMFNDVLTVIFLGIALCAAVTGIVFSALGHRKAVQGARGMGFALAGLLCGTAVASLCVAMGTLMIVAVSLA